MDQSAKEAEGLLEDKWRHLAQPEDTSLDTVEKVEEFIARERVRVTGGR